MEMKGEPILNVQMNTMAYFAAHAQKKHQHNI